MNEKEIKDGKDKIKIEKTNEGDYTIHLKPNTSSALVSVAKNQAGETKSVTNIDLLGKKYLKISITKKKKTKTADLV